MAFVWRSSPLLEMQLYLTLLFIGSTSIVVCIVITEWYIRSGVSGIFSICLSSEMFQVSIDWYEQLSACPYINFL